MEQFYQQNTIYQSNYITCVIENGIIYQYNGLNQKTPVGVDNTNYEELLKKAEEYHKMLVDNKIITVPKTPEEVNAELLETIKNLTDRIEKMEVNKDVRQNDSKIRDKSSNAETSKTNGK